MEKIRVMLVDYDAITRAGISAILGEGSLAEVVGVAVGVHDFLERFETLNPAVVITNVQNTKGVDAVEITRLVKQARPEVPVIVITDDERDPFAIDAVEAGISAYVLRRSVSTQSLESVMKTVMETGSAVLSAPLMRTVIASLSRNANIALAHSTDGEVKDLTDRELDVLRFMAAGATNQEISSALGISHETARKHVTRIIEKLGARNRTQAAIIGNHAAISGHTNSSGPA